jgi:hypothetical protein
MFQVVSLPLTQYLRPPVSYSFHPVNPISLSMGVLSSSGFSHTDCPFLLQYGRPSGEVCLVHCAAASGAGDAEACFGGGKGISIANSCCVVASMR